MCFENFDKHIITCMYVLMFQILHSNFHLLPLRAQQISLQIINYTILTTILYLIQFIFFQNLQTEVMRQSTNCKIDDLQRDINLESLILK